MEDQPEDAFQAMLDWLPELAADPMNVATAFRTDQPGVPAFTAMVPGTAAFVDYLVVEQYSTVVIVGCSDLRIEDLGGDPD
jgi:hypothetical protein